MIVTPGTREKMFPFPTHPDLPLPETLLPWRPDHYWLLIKWIYFQPDRLRRYLYRLDPDLYRQNGRIAWKIGRVPGYRNLYLMVAVLALGLGMGMAWITAVLQNNPLNQTAVAGAVTGIIVGIGFGAGINTILALTLGIGGGAAVGAATGMVTAVALAVAGSAVGSGYIDPVAAAVFGILGGTAFGVAFGVTGGAAGGTASGLLIGLLLAGSGAFLMLTTGEYPQNGFTVPNDLIIIFGAGWLAGSSRLLFHLFEYPLSWFCLRRKRTLHNHPAYWDELAVWHLPGIDLLLLPTLTADFEQGVRPATLIAANPFQRAAVQYALSSLLANSADPLRLLYRLLHLPALKSFPVLPANRVQARFWLSSRELLLGEVGQQFVDATGGITISSEIAEQLIWRFTRRRRQMQPTPFSRFSAVLYQLLRAMRLNETGNGRAADLASHLAAIGEALRPFPHGDEIAASFTATAALLNITTLEAIAAAYGTLAPLNDLSPPLLRPKVIETLKALGDISREGATYLQATNTMQRAAALNRAAGELNELAAYIQEHVQAPERMLLHGIATSWQSTIAVEQGRLGQAALQEMTPVSRRAIGAATRQSSVWQRPATPIDNPYIAGDPVYPPLFIGRRDIFNRISEVWTAKENPDSIILYGHRRMGKSSILRNLDQVAPPGSMIVYADMAGETSFVESTTDLLLGLADKIYTVLHRAFPGANLSEPDPAAYTGQARAQLQFNRLLERARDLLGKNTLILALDEFEAIEQAVAEEKIGPQIYRFLRTKTQEPWITLVFGGLHTLDEMSRDYYQPFYGSYTNIRVSYLDHDKAWQLITNPRPDFTLNYEHEAVERIIAETGGQPYLIQQVCRDALDHLNHELFDLHLEREALITLRDVEAVLDEDFFRRGTVYFDGVWAQTTGKEQRLVLRTMAQRETPWTSSQLETATQLPAAALHHHLQWAERHDIVQESAGDPPRQQFHVPLMRRWIQLREAGK